MCAQSCPTLCDSHGLYSLPGSSVHGILQARILEWVAISSSMGSSKPKNQTHISWVSCIGRRVLYHCTTWEPPRLKKMVWPGSFWCFDFLFRLSAFWIQSSQVEEGGTNWAPREPGIPPDWLQSPGVLLGWLRTNDRRQVVVSLRYPLTNITILTSHSSSNPGTSWHTGGDPYQCFASELQLGGPLCLDLALKKVLTYFIRFSLNSLTAWFGKHFLAAT